MNELFQRLGLSEALLTGLSRLGISQPTEIQQQTIPLALAGKDIIGQSATGARVIIVTGCINALVSRVSETFIKNLHLIFL
ncbi:MAG: DEAD/DEAH box helicase [Veillonellaceae bacterium]|nr:DEAD/DEAH box helicase [Veillonellaceae bacterium]